MPELFHGFDFDKERHHHANYPVETIYEWLDKGAEVIARDRQIPYIEGLAEAGEAFFTGSADRGLSEEAEQR
ncbi:hypothetical protein PO124_09595 [Bacillus licheniformis]|nr:hypothetical protein [Bacillus licheniformis]